jgi:hypothetical protein
MLKFFRREAKNHLEEALESCKKANSQGYSEAQKYLKGLDKSVKDASGIISKCIDNMKRYRINDDNTIATIKQQLELVQTEFEKTYFETGQSIKEKYKMSSTFNITLFGRTKAGKSTLMEILTHGDGSHMGKGGQRTTRDVRSYNWNGMSVTDVPGIDAYGGEEDDQKALEAAVYADLILFMITAGQPEGTEADWLVRLKRMDKPIVCICNYKQSIGEGINDFRLKRLLENPSKLEERMNISELNAQFNTFINEQLPNESVDFIVTHLLAKFASQQPEYRDKSRELEGISRFSAVENSIINEVYDNGVLHRKKCYLSIIDAPLFQQMNQLLAFSSSAYGQFKVIQDKTNKFSEWCRKFNDDQKDNIKNVVEREYNQLRNSIPGFVESHLEDDDVNESWKRHCKRYPIQSNINKSVSDIKKRLEDKVGEIFSELNTEMNLTFSFNTNSDLGNYKFVNWKKCADWAGAVGSVGLTIAATLSAGALFWASLAVFAVSAIFSFFCDSREKKLRERRIKLSKKLNESIDKAIRSTRKQLLDAFYSDVIGQEEKVKDRLRLVGRSMLSLSCGERQLAFGYAKNHKDISKMIIANIFYALKIPMAEFDKIECVARVPGRRIAIVVNGEYKLPCKVCDLVDKLGNKEHINIVKLRQDMDTESKVCSLLRYFRIMVPPLVDDRVNGGKQTVVYLYNKGFDQEKLDSIDLIQQILNVHIILK